VEIRAVGKEEREEGNEMGEQRTHEVFKGRRLRKQSEELVPGLYGSGVAWVITASAASAAVYIGRIQKSTKYGKNSRPTGTKMYV